MKRNMTIIAGTVAAVIGFSTPAVMADRGSDKVMPPKAGAAAVAKAHPCPACDSKAVKESKIEKGNVKTESVRSVHLCSKCGTKIEVNRTGKSAKEKVTHLCKSCGG